jgi:gamma-glutamyltranspeptidase/glutathione hydrolase
MGEDVAGLSPVGILRLESGVPEATHRALGEMNLPLGPSDAAMISTNASRRI